MVRGRRNAGTSLVELLVVMVVFLVGILAIVQVFPGGFRILGITRSNSQANALARSEIERLKANAAQLPEQILPVRYIFSGGTITIVADPNRNPNNLGPDMISMDANGNMADTGGNTIGNWQYLVGSNVMRRVIGEGKRVPAPRYIGSQYGGLMVLQFAPIVYNPTYQSLFVVYGNDMTRRQGDPTQPGRTIRTWEYYIDSEDDSNATIYFPQLNKAIKYRVNLSALVNSGGGVVRRDVVDYVVNVPASATPGLPYPVQVSTMAGLQAGETLNSIDYYSVRTARAFEQIPTAQTFDTSDPYEYKLLSPELGLILFNDKGYSYVFQRGNGRRDPLQGRVSYDVYDWRIIREEFKGPDTWPAEYRLALSSIKVRGDAGVDGTTYNGLGPAIPNGAGGTQQVDLIVQDMASGGVLLHDPSNPPDPSPPAGYSGDTPIDPTRSSYSVNKSVGVVRFWDYDRDATNGLQVRVILPGATAPITVTASSRNFRVMYEAKGEWAVQTLKPAARYTETGGGPGIGQFYVGGGAIGGSPTRLYFPNADAGRNVTIGEIYYNWGGSMADPGPSPHGPETITATIQTTPADPLGYPYIEMTNYIPNFGTFNYAYTFAVRNVKGASVAVRVLWNPALINLTPSSATNMERLDQWMQQYRRTTVETFLNRSED